MQWDLGLQGLGLLAVMSLAYGVFAQLMFWSRTTSWVWLVASVASFVVGMFMSEVWFGWATAVDLQPNIDGLSFDEVLLGFLVGIPIVLVTRYLARKSGLQRPISP
jgi:Na+/proline symporter